jgi:flagellar assembly protein FliH
MSSSSDRPDPRTAARGGPLPNVAAPAGSKAAPSYSRFIPREELGSFTAWQPGALTGGERRAEERRQEDRGTTDRRASAAGTAAAGGVNGAAHAGANGLANGHAAGHTNGHTNGLLNGRANGLGARHGTPGAAAAGAPPVTPPAEWQARVTAARQAGYQDGYRDGLVALEGFKHSFAQQTTAQVGALLVAFDEQLLALDGEMAQAVARTALLLAQQVLRSEVQTRPELVAEVARQAINTVMHSARQITVHVHPQDLPLVSQGAEEALSARRARLRADSSINRGGVLVHSDVGTVDARLDTRWAEAVAAFGVPPLHFDHSRRAATLPAASAAASTAIGTAESVARSDGTIEPDAAPDATEGP